LPNAQADKKHFFFFFVLQNDLSLCLSNIMECDMTPHLIVPFNDASYAIRSELQSLSIASLQAVPQLIPLDTPL
jgi:hypothetical protein